jgi:hypothetical protein
MNPYKLLSVSGGWHILKGDDVLWPEPNEDNAKVLFSLLVQEIEPLLERTEALQSYHNQRELLIRKINDCQTIEQVQDLLQDNHLRGLADIFDLPFQDNDAAQKERIEAFDKENHHLRKMLENVLGLRSWLGLQLLKGDIERLLKKEETNG